MTCTLNQRWCSIQAGRWIGLGRSVWYATFCKLINAGSQMETWMRSRHIPRFKVLKIWPFDKTPFCRRLWLKLIMLMYHSGWSKTPQLTVFCARSHEYIVCASHSILHTNLLVAGGFPAQRISTWWCHQMETFPRYWPFVRGIHRSPVNSPHKVQWRGALVLSLTCAGVNGWLNNREAGDLRRHGTHYDVTVMNL